MKNIIEQAGTIQSRHGRTDKPEGFEALYLDAHNENKAHHIIVNEDGVAFYNQAIRNGETWQDFYEWEEVGCNEAHGYRKYIDQGIIDRRLRNDKAAGDFPITTQVGEQIEYWNNQAYRPATVMAILGKEAMLIFEMPSGQEYIHIVKTDDLSPSMRFASSWIRTISWNRIPKKWARAAGL